MANLSITVIDGNNVAVNVSARASQIVTIDRSVSGPIGPPGMVWKGAWNSSTTYAVNDAVSNGGSSYICTVANTNQAPPNVSYWDILAQNGSITSVGLSAPALFTVSGSPVTTSGTLSLTYSGTALPVANGGTGLTSLTAGYIPFGAGTSAFGSSSNLFWDSANGRLGVGTSSPTAPLSASISSAGASPTLVIGNTDLTSGGAVRANFISGDDGTVGRTRAIIEAASDGTNNGRIAFYTRNAGAFVEQLRITYAGNVGIGTASPSQKLDVQGNVNLIAGGQMLWGGGTSYYIQSDNSTYMRFATASTIRMYIDSSGLVGIGTTAVTSRGRLNVISTTQPKVYVGYDTTTADTYTAINKDPALQITGDGTANNSPNINLIQVNVSGLNVTQAAPTLGLSATRGATAGTRVAVADTDLLGEVAYFGDDGTNVRSRGAFIQSVVDTTTTAVSTGVIPARLVMGTTSNASIQFITNGGSYTGGSAVKTTNVRMTITQNGGISFGSSGTNYGTSGQVLTSAGNAAPTWTTPTTGTVTSVSWTGGIVSVATATTTPAFTIAGTSGGIPYFSSASTWASSAALAANAIVLGGGAGAAPATTTTGTGVVTALGNATNATGGLATTDGTATLTNKRITSRVLVSSANSATPTINTDNYDMMVITGQSVAITSFTTNLTGTPTNGQKLWISVTGTGAVAITWGASFESSTVTLPTTTVTTARLDVGFVWNAATNKWRCVASA